MIDEPAAPAAASTARLSASREAIARRLGADAAPGAASGAAEPAAAGATGFATLAGWMLDAADAGALRDPVRAGLHLAGNAVRASVAPVARDHPWGLVGAGVLGGALLAATRPWRWALRPALLASVVSQLLVPSLAQCLARRPRGGPGPVPPR